MKKKRLFLVGCPRSGTTLLQSMIATHRQVISFPETHFFSGTLPINPFLRRLKLHGKTSRKFVQQFLDENGYQQIEPLEHTPRYVTHKKWCNILLNILDLMTARDTSSETTANTVWGLEKTPRHLHYISSIEHADSSNKFLHILREGADVVASLYLATHKYPEEWSGKRSVKKCVSWWNNSIRASLKHKNKSNHFYVIYKQLLDEPEKVLRATCKFLDLNYEPAMVEQFHQTADSLTKEKEEWKKQNKKRDLTKSNKLETHFDSSTINYIKNNTIDIDLKQFYH